MQNLNTILSNEWQYYFCPIYTPLPDFDLRGDFCGDRGDSSGDFHCSSYKISKLGNSFSQCYPNHPFFSDDFRFNDWNGAWSQRRNFDRVLVFVAADHQKHLYWHASSR